MAHWICAGDARVRIDIKYLEFDIWNQSSTTWHDFRLLNEPDVGLFQALNLVHYVSLKHYYSDRQVHIV